MFQINNRTSKCGLATLFLLIGTIGWGQSGTIHPGAEARRPNILFVLLDNIGKDWFRCYGSQEDVTPNLDRLAQTCLGRRFGRALVVAPFDRFTDPAVFR